MMSGPLDVKAVLTARDELSQFLMAALQRYPIDRKKLAILGFSQGGVMAYSLGLEEPARFSGIAAVSSWLPSDLLTILPDGPTSEQLPIAGSAWQPR